MNPTDKIITELSNKRKINGGQPIVAAIYDSNHEILTIKSNEPSKLENKNKYDHKNHLGHAERLAIDEIDWNKFKPENLTLIISTEPCKPCSIFISKFQKKYGMFKKIYFLFSKRDGSFKSNEILDNIEHYVDIKQELKFETFMHILDLKEHWEESNLSLRRKTLMKRSTEQNTGTLLLAASSN